MPTAITISPQAPASTRLAPSTASPVCRRTPRATPCGWTMPRITPRAGRTYSFTGLLPSNAAGYTITETQPAGYTDAFDAKNGLVIPGSNTTDVISGVVLAVGATAANNTFGEYGGILSKQLIDTSIDN